MRLLYSIYILCAVKLVDFVQSKRNLLQDKPFIENFDFDNFFGDFKSSKEINEAIQVLYQKAVQITNDVSLYSIGKSAEGRPILALSIGKRATIAAKKVKKHKSTKVFKYNGPLENTERTDILLIAGLHGREWTAPASVIYTAHEMIENLLNSNSSELDRTFHFIPLLNPDGYEYTLLNRDNEVARLWRKTRRNLCSRRNRNKRCAHGIDLNRNFGIDTVSWGFGATKVTTEVFQGTRPFSEPESKRIGEFFSLIGHTLLSVLDVHCCSAAVLPPFMYKDDVPKQQTELDSLCKEMNSEYPCKNREKSFSESNTGIFIDWVFNEVQVPYSFIVETKGNKDRHMDKIFTVEPTEIKTIGSSVNSIFQGLLKALRSLEVPSQSHEESQDYEESVGETVTEEAIDFERLFNDLKSGGMYKDEVDQELQEIRQEKVIKITSDENIFSSTSVDKNNFFLISLVALTVSVLLLAVRNLSRKKKNLKTV